MEEVLSKNWFVWGVGLILVFQVGVVVLGEAAYRLQRQGRPTEAVARALRNFVLPLVIVLLFLTQVLELDPEGVLARMVETALWIGVIWVALSVVSAVVFQGAAPGSWRANAPKLFLDLTRLFMVFLGTAFVLSAVWNRDLGGLLAALGVGSIVIGLALQDTLGNLMAGIALVFERPFAVGDWIKVGDIEGAVIEMNWRSVRLRTRERDLMVVPNSVLGKEIITNNCAPTMLHAERIPIAFSFQAPPNKVKEVLQRVALSIPDVLPEPKPKIETVSYGDDRILYEAKIYLENQRAIPRVRDAFATRAWYAAQRHGLVLPLPRRTILTRVIEADEEAAVPVTPEELAAVPAFSRIASPDLEKMAGESVHLRFAAREDILLEGERSDSLYAIAEGRASVSARDAAGGDREVLELSRGDVFGERSLLTQEPSPVTVTALEDLSLLRLRPSAVRAALDQNPGTARALAELVDARAKAVERIRRSAEDRPGGRNLTNAVESPTEDHP